jgi:uncharacterized protein YlxW (UPF0749 family)
MSSAMRKEVEKLQKEYQALQQQKIQVNATLSQLQKMEDSKSFDQNKRNSQQGNNSGTNNGN